MLVYYNIDYTDYIHQNLIVNAAVFVFVLLPKLYLQSVPGIVDFKK
jgi:hypothetical protein